MFEKTSGGGVRHVRLTHIDGKLPNLALMKLAHFHRHQYGDTIHFTKDVDKGLFEPRYDYVYGSAIFTKSADRVARFRDQFPQAVVGGTWSLANNETVEERLGIGEYEYYDYSIYPGFDASIGFTQRGCRLKCGFCVVPKKEGKPRSVMSIYDIWRGEGFPRHIHLFDNDFFGQPEDQWRARIAEIKDGGFKVCINQGINVRLIHKEGAEALASIPYYDDSFRSRRIYTAWDNLKDEKVFMRGVNLLQDAGIPTHHIMVYMLVGFDKNETWGRVLYRFNKMVAMGMRPYPMIYGDRYRSLPLGECNQRVGHKPLWEFQKWAIRRYYEMMDFEQFDNNATVRRGQTDMLEVVE